MNWILIYLFLATMVSCSFAQSSEGEVCSGEKPKTCGGNGRKLVGWYWNKTWFRCMATTSTCPAQGLFPSAEECNNRCRPFDGPSCTGPRGSATPLGPPSSSGPPGCGGDATCPAGHRCVGGAFFSSCCPADQLDAVEQAFAPTCPDGSGAHPDEYLTGLSCDDLLCPNGFQCKKINAFFARCCAGGAPEKKPPIGGQQSDFSVDGAALQSGEPTNSLRIVDAASRLAAVRLMAPFRRDCFDRHPDCPGWAQQFQGTLVWWNSNNRWQRFQLPADHCEWNAFLKTMNGCPLSCGTCSQKQIKFQFFPQSSTLLWV